jgi:hypothetical protein
MLANLFSTPPFRVGYEIDLGQLAGHNYALSRSIYPASSVVSVNLGRTGWILLYCLFRCDYSGSDETRSGLSPSWTLEVEKPGRNPAKQSCLRSCGGANSPSFHYTTIASYSIVISGVQLAFQASWQSQCVE